MAGPSMVACFFRELYSQSFFADSFIFDNRREKSIRLREYYNASVAREMKMNLNAKSTAIACI